MDKIEKIELGGICSAHEGEDWHIQGFGGNTEEIRPLGKPRRRWKDNIKIDVQEVECGGRDWIELAQDRDRWRALGNEVMNLRVP